MSPTGTNIILVVFMCYGNGGHEDAATVPETDNAHGRNTIGRDESSPQRPVSTSSQFKLLHLTGRPRSESIEHRTTAGRGAVDSVFITLMFGASVVGNTLQSNALENSDYFFRVT